jgi:hypothetical protein
MLCDKSCSVNLTRQVLADWSLPRLALFPLNGTNRVAESHGHYGQPG